MTPKQAEKFLARLVKSNETDCWFYRGSVDSSQYAMVGETPAHRISYECFVGDIAKGNVIHHECEVKACVNPRHLRSMTPHDHLSYHACKRAAAKKRKNCPCGEPTMRTANKGLCLRCYLKQG